MKIWVDAQLPPTLASWLNSRFEVEALSLKDLGLRDARDIEIFEAARAANAVIMTKDSDFINLVCRLGIPPQIIWLTCGNVTNRNLHQLLSKTLTINLTLSKGKFSFARSRIASLPQRSGVMCKIRLRHSAANAKMA